MNAGKTPGQAAYEARQVAKGRRMGADESTPDSEILAVIALSWDELPPGMRADEEAGARAAITADPEVRAFHRLVAEIAGYAVGAGLAHGALMEIQGKARALLFGDTPVSGRCPEGCGCRLGTDDAARRECGCDGPCTTGWEPQPVPAPAGAQWTEAEFAAALDGFHAWFTVTGGGARVQGQLLGLDAVEFARALDAQLSANRAHQDPEG